MLFIMKEDFLLFYFSKGNSPIFSKIKIKQKWGMCMGSFLLCFIFVCNEIANMLK